MIYHLALPEDWQAAQTAGEYRMSTRGRRLEEEGFIHCSQASQVEATANRYYDGVNELVLLTIDEARLRSPMRYDDVHGSSEPFPHIYGPLHLDAVAATRSLRRDAAGRFPAP